MEKLLKNNVVNNSEYTDDERTDSKQIKDDEAKDEKITSTIQYVNPSIRTYTSDVAFKTIMSGIEDELYVIPNFQRFYKWDTDQAEELATSLVRGMPIPPIYVYREENGVLSILDGQQRIISLYLYYKGKARKNNRTVIDFKNDTIKNIVSDENRFVDHVYNMHYYKDSINDILEEECVKIKYDELPKENQRIVDYRTLTVIEIQMDDRKYRKNNLFKIFANLNSGGTPLSAQELRNGLYGCKFYSMLFDINDNKTWRNNYGDYSKDSKDIELLLRFCALSNRTSFDKDTNRFRVKPFKKYISMLNDFSEESTGFTDDMVNNNRSKLLAFINHYKIDYKRSIALCEAAYVVTALFPELLPKMKYGVLVSILSEGGFIESVSGGTASTIRIEKRLKIVYEALSEIH